MTDRLSMQDPRSQYPKPPFPKQPQPAPGLVAKMEPRPDHGEESYNGSGKLAGRRALITGGDSGIGRAAAIAYAREGADVAINYLPVEEPDAREVIELVQAEGRKAVAIPGDIRDEAFCNTLVETAVRELGGLDIIVNNAANQQSVDAIADLTTEQFDATFRTNVYAMFWITKAAIVAFTKSLAKQVAEKGIRVNAVAPGPFWTPLQPSGGQPTKKVTEFGAEAPMGRPGQPAEIAGVYVLLASQESSFATGQVYGASGGNGQPKRACGASSRFRT